MPRVSVVKDPEVAEAPLSGLVEVNTGLPEQVGSPGGKSANVTVPVGAKPPVTVAVSNCKDPIGPPSAGTVSIAGVARVAVTASSAQPELTPSLFASPL